MNGMNKSSDNASTRESPPPLDTTLTIISPENITFEFRLAGPAARSVAFLLDAIIVAMGIFGLLFVIGITGLFNEAFLGLFLIAAFFIWWGYGAACEILTNGRTAGKAALGLRVVSQTGLSINAAQAILRNLLRLIDIAPPFVPGVIAMTFTSRLQRLGDLAAGTVVVLERSRRPPRPPRVEHTTASLVPRSFIAAPPLIEALAAYVGRRHELSYGRRMELAGLAAKRLTDFWKQPASADPDRLLCTVYELAITAESGEP
jgi:uncharacterized RDD family membrane protein YckC